ncbi:Hypothetical predicted protein [Mytilus galloprovincialis]|uniref:Mab-21-like HhH/H2TH-like domain-containing protein n=1 Tax=Mytilus galloprovincialis TaxID=29158 RepID=A0A8B6H3V8_MYTGA|nr:Hypothetical predicted protein [Mytilus galloprovincialis]
METDKNICKRLYHCLCETIGSEEVVKVRRQFYATVDYLTEKNDLSLVISGSRAEGLEMGSDIDVMCLLKLVSVSEERTADSFLITNNFVMETDDCKPCFTQLKGNSCYYDAIVNWLSTPFGQELRFESGRIRSWIVSIVSLFRPVTLHGPCASDMNESGGFSDITICLRCPVFIQQAQPWIKRERFWPSPKLVSNICSYGTLLVPIGSKNSQNEHLEWRMSFSVAEKHLIFTFTHTQFLCYALLKLMLKQVIDTKEKFNGLLCSYFLKTVLFWVSEESQQSIWRPENILPVFMKCFKRLIYCVYYKYLPHYFIIENNLFDCRFNRQQHQDFLLFLNELYSNGIMCLRNCRLLSNFFNRIPLAPKMSDTEVVCCSLNAIVRMNSRSYFRIIGMFCILGTPSAQLKMGKVFIKRILKIRPNGFIPFIAFCWFCQLIGKSMDCHSKCPNMYRYKLLKQFLPYLFMGLHTDSVACWMYLATYYYCFGHYITSLKLIFHAWNECTSDKLFNAKCTLTSSNISAIEKEGIRQKIWKRRHVYKYHLVNEISFYYNSRVIPPELVVQPTTLAYIPSRVYIYFLRFLCLYRLHEDFQCMQAIEDLRLSVSRTHREEHECALGEAYHCLATALMIFRQTNEARLYFAKSKSYKEKCKGFYF